MDDNKEPISIHVHRNILASNCDYFMKLFTFNPNTNQIWDALSGQLINTLNGHHDVVRSVAFSPDGSKIVSASNNKTVKIWDVLSGQLINTLTGHHNFVLSVAFSY